MRIFLLTLAVVTLALVAMATALFPDPSADNAAAADNQPGPPANIEQKQSDVFVMDARKLSHRFDGFGVQIEGADVNHRAVLDALKLRYVRIELGPNWYMCPERIPNGATREEMDAFVERQFNGDSPIRLEGALKAWRILTELGIEVMHVVFQIPYQWLDEDFWRTLYPQHHDDFIRFQGSLAQFLTKHGMRPKFVELSNEPDGNWNGHIPEGVYGKLVIALRKELDDRGLQAIGILGPGVAFLDREDVGERYINAMSTDAVQALAGWSIHCWDEVDFPHALPEFIHRRWADVQTALTKIDPQRTMPLHITEFSTEVCGYPGGRVFKSPRAGGPDTATETVPYAVRVFTNTLIHINNGASSLVFWRLCDHSWHSTTWGLLGPETGGRQPRPVAWCIHTLLPHVPHDSMALEPEWFREDDTIHAAAFLGPANEGSDDRTFVVALANTTLAPQSRVLEFRGFARLRAISRHSFVDGKPVNETPADGEPVPGLQPDGDDDVFRLSVTLPAESTRTLVLRGRLQAADGE